MRGLKLFSLCFTQISLPSVCLSPCLLLPFSLLLLVFLLCWNSLINFTLFYKVFIIVLVILGFQLVQWKNSEPLSVLSSSVIIKRHKNYFKIHCICLHLDYWHSRGVRLRFKRKVAFLNVDLLKDVGPWSLFLYLKMLKMGLPWWLSGQESACQYRRRGFKRWIRKIPWRRKWQPTPVFLPGKSNGQKNLLGCCSWGLQKSGMT